MSCGICGGIEFQLAVGLEMASLARVPEIEKVWLLSVDERRQWDETKRYENSDKILTTEKNK